MKCVRFHFFFFVDRACVLDCKHDVVRIWYLQGIIKDQAVLSNVCVSGKDVHRWWTGFSRWQKQSWKRQTSTNNSWIPLNGKRVEVQVCHHWKEKNNTAVSECEQMHVPLTSQLISTASGAGHTILPGSREGKMWQEKALLPFTGERCFSPNTYNFYVCVHNRYTHTYSTISTDTSLFIYTPSKGF